MEDLSEIKTEFLEDRLKETSWANRKYIQQLASLERVIFKNGPQCFNQAMVYYTLKKRYPVEYECIKKEFTTGILTSAAEFRKLKRKSKKQQIVANALEIKQELEQRKKDKSKWVEAGGRY